MSRDDMPSFTGGTRREEMIAEFFKPDDDENPAIYAPNSGGIAPDAVNHPAHYKQYPVEVIDIIRHVLGDEGFRAYCLGNEIKYRMRAGWKGDAAQDIAKALKYADFRRAAE